MDITESQVEKICKKCNFDLISFKLLGIGAFNYNYLLETKQGKFVLRIEISPQFHYKKEEYEILKSLNGKFGPKVYFFDESKKIIPTDYLIEEFIDFGEHPPAEATDEFIEKMGNWFKRLHQIKTKIEDSTYDLESGFKWGYERYNGNKQALEKEYQEILDSLLKRVFEVIKHNNKDFPKRKYFSLCQGDPTRSNIFYSDKEIKLVDWEFAMYHLREYDLAFFIWSYDLEEKNKLAFLKHTDYPITNSSLKLLELMYLIRCIDMLGWRVERLRMIKEKKIDPKLTNSTIKEIMEGIREDIQRIEIALKNPFL